MTHDKFIAKYDGKFLEVVGSFDFVGLFIIKYSYENNCQFA